MVVHKTKDDFPSTNVGGPKNEEFLGAKKGGVSGKQTGTPPFWVVHNTKLTPGAAGLVALVLL